jgi:hypothetical protein
MAQKWAQYLANTNTFKHSGASGVGENIYMSYGLAVNGKTAVDAWYAEVKDYNCASPGFSLSTGIFYASINLFTHLKMQLFQVILPKLFGSGPNN